MNKYWIGLLCGLGAASIWGGMYVVSKVVLDVIPPFTLLTIRLVMGALVLGVIVFLRRKTNFTREQFRNSLLVGFVGYGKQAVTKLLACEVCFSTQKNYHT